MTARPERPATSLNRRALVQGTMTIAAGIALGATPFRDATAQQILGTGRPAGYTNGSALVSVETLRAMQIVDTDLVLVNVLLPDATDLAYIPGSIALVIPELAVVDTSDASIEGWHQAIQARLGELGITPESTVVAYDNDTLFSARLWWVLHYLGHENAHVLDGGISAWQAAGQDVVMEAMEPAAADPYPGTPNGDLLAQKDEVLAAIEAGDSVMLDARVLEEYAEGHIPGAVNLNFPLNATTESPKMYKPAEELLAMYEEIGVTPDRHIVPYCATGVRSAVTAFALHLIGFENVALYTGSWAEWGEDPDAPVTTGEEP